ERFKGVEWQWRAGNDLAPARRKRTLPDIAVTLPAAVLDVGGFTLFNRRRQCSGRPSCSKCKCNHRRHNREQTHGTPPQRGWVKTLPSAGWPDLPAATASLIAGPRSAGSTIGPFAHQPIDCAS